MPNPTGELREIVAAYLLKIRSTEAAGDFILASAVVQLILLAIHLKTSNADAADYFA
jgi:hypothetical protein